MTSIVSPTADGLAVPHDFVMGELENKTVPKKKKNKMMMKKKKKKKSSGNIQVAVRLRPENKREKRDLIEPPVQKGMDESVLVDDGSRTWKFDFDTVYSMETTQLTIFQTSFVPLVEDFFSGLNVAVLAYGATGSGKTYTMGLEEASRSSILPNVGAIPRIFRLLFDMLESESHTSEFTLELCFIQVYNGMANDLLLPRDIPLRVRETSPGKWEPTAIMKRHARTYGEVLDLIREALENRTTASTASNATSSRSHAILRVDLIRTSLESGSSTRSTLDLVDLAGSECCGKTGVSGGVRMKEMCNINTSLQTLGMVIDTLSKRKRRSGNVRSHVPFRNSLLTKLLAHTIGGNSRTQIIICASPAISSIKETMTSIRFGQRAAEIVNEPTIRTELTTDELLRQIEVAQETIAIQEASIRRKNAEVMRLKELAKELLSGNPIYEDHVQQIEDKEALRFESTGSLALLPGHILNNIFTFAGAPAMFISMLACSRFYRHLCNTDWPWRIVGTSKNSPFSIQVTEGTSWKKALGDFLSTKWRLIQLAKAAEFENMVQKHNLHGGGLNITLLKGQTVRCS